jgi:AcrR family transcriptional regulator
MDEFAEFDSAPASGEPGESSSEGASADSRSDGAYSRSDGTDSRSEARSRTDTRARIQQVAVELFSEHGYEGTSLREIAERLDVTKAALYYHFKSKEDIVASLVEDYYGQIDDLIEWGRTQPKTLETRIEIMRRYIQILADGGKVFRMLQHNQAAVNTLASEQHKGHVFRERMQSLVDTLTEPGDSLKVQVGAAMLLGGVSIAWMTFADRVQDREELSEIVFGLASEVLSSTAS